MKYVSLLLLLLSIIFTVAITVQLVRLYSILFISSPQLAGWLLLVLLTLLI